MGVLALIPGVDLLDLLDLGRVRPGGSHGCRRCGGSSTALVPGMPEVELICVSGARLSIGEAALTRWFGLIALFQRVRMAVSAAVSQKTWQCKRGWNYLDLSLTTAQTACTEAAREHHFLLYFVMSLLIALAKIGVGCDMGFSRQEQAAANRPSNASKAEHSSMYPATIERLKEAARIGAKRQRDRGDRLQAGGQSQGRGQRPQRTWTDPSGCACHVKVNQAESCQCRCRSGFRLLPQVPTPHFEFPLSGPRPFLCVRVQRG